MPSPQLFDLIQLILDLTRDSEGQKKDSPIILTDESSLVAGSIELSNLINICFEQIIKFPTTSS